MAKYGAIVYFGMFLMALFVFGGIMWFAFDKQAEISNIFVKSLEVQERITENQEKVIRALGNLANSPETGGSGIIEVETIPPNENG